MLIGELEALDVAIFAILRLRYVEQPEPLRKTGNELAGHGVHREGIDLLVEDGTGERTRRGEIPFEGGVKLRRLEWPEIGIAARAGHADGVGYEARADLIETRPGNDLRPGQAQRQIVVEIDRQVGAGQPIAEIGLDHRRGGRRQKSLCRARRADIAHAGVARIMQAPDIAFEIALHIGAQRILPDVLDRGRADGDRRVVGIGSRKAQRVARGPFVERAAQKIAGKAAVGAGEKGTIVLAVAEPGQLVDGQDAVAVRIAGREQAGGDGQVLRIGGEQLDTLVAYPGLYRGQDAPLGLILPVQPPVIAAVFGHRVIVEDRQQLILRRVVRVEIGIDRQVRHRIAAPEIITRVRRVSRARHDHISE